MAVGGHWFRGGSRRLLGLRSRAWRVLRGAGRLVWVARRKWRLGTEGGWCVWPEIVVARLMAVEWVAAATAEIGRKGRVGVALPR